MNRRSVSGAPPRPLAPTAVAVLMPGAAAGEWELCRALSVSVSSAIPSFGNAPSRGATRQTFPNLDAAAANLMPDEGFVLALPIEMGLIQRFSLPAAEPSELEEMARIQLEKILPYPADALGVATQEISRGEADVVLAVETVYYDRLRELCRGLVARDLWPLRVVFQAVALTGDGSSAFLYRESGRYVLGISENGRVSFAQALGAQTAEDLAAEMPAVLLGAELDGVPTGFGVLRLDDREGDGGGILAAVLNVPVEPFDTGAAAVSSVSGVSEVDLSPPQWRAERLRGERRARIKQRILLGAAIYAGLLVLAFLWLGITKFRAARLETRLRRLRPLAEVSEAGIARWKTMAPAFDWTRYLAEALDQVCACLPPGDTVRLTAFDQTARGISIQGEAPSAAAAVDFTDKLRARPELKWYHFTSDPPSILSNGRAKFRIAGNL